ncbi:hypothetical protein SEA_YOSIF_76 [Streptomyces phage Yosif]|uniref:Uncharacterized protein n=1 Tax=Streptomyces phage Yosif TaxID=2201421 RepID=A0A2Z4QDA3_9CAUD|nr:hypothetical protein KGG71_gp76 [Streptomyces phage Yosif]AWY07640.1 hypothetical protein SEA_YOSIF_76 [Streptomyces phage Yosif]
MTVSLIKSTDRSELTVGEVQGLRDALEERQKLWTEQNRYAIQARSELSSFKKNLRATLRDHVDTGEIERTAANGILEALGERPLTRKYRATIQVEVEIEGLEFPDGDELEEHELESYLDINVRTLSGLSHDWADVTITEVDLEEQDDDE